LTSKGADVLAWRAGKQARPWTPGRKCEGCAERGGDDVVDMNMVPLEREFLEYIGLTCVLR